MINILIYGGNGWIGKQFIDILKDKKIKYIKGNNRVDNVKKIEEEINKTKPSHVISLIGRTHGEIKNKKYTTIDYLEQKGKLLENTRDNLFSPLVLAKICEKENIHFTYLGTGCIFTYDDNHKTGFKEDDLPNFFGSSYSIIKGYTDQIMKLFDNVLNVRIRMPINSEENERNFITKITNYNKICSIQNSMTVLPDLLPIMLDMMMKKEIGTINLTNPGLISHNEILEMYREIVDPLFKWENFTLEEQSRILESERSNNLLNTTKLEYLYPHVKNIKDAVRDCLHNYSIRYEPTNLLVTGGCGFIGSNFINFYYNSNPKVKIINIDNMYYCANENNIFQEIRDNNRYKFIKGNICLKDLIESILEEYNIDAVIHFAAQSHVQNSFEDSLQYTNDNILGTHNLLECCRKYKKIQRFIHVSTDEVYGESMLTLNESKKNEQSVLCPTNPYAATKASAELIAQSYNHSFKFPIIITRGNNVYGLNQYHEKLIPRFIKLLKENKKVTIQGDGSCVRAFLHIEDTVNAFRFILEKGKIGEIYNIGCDDNMEYSVMQIAEILIEKIKKSSEYHKWIKHIDDRPFNDKRYYISNDKLKSLGWKIQKSFEVGIDELCNE